MGHVRASVVGWVIAMLAVACASHTADARSARPEVVRCDRGRCPPPYTCRYRERGGKIEGECALETGRCNSDLDCAPVSQRCQRFGVDPGVCVLR